jgi:hypothetical protein
VAKAAVGQYELPLGCPFCRAALLQKLFFYATRYKGRMPKSDTSEIARRATLRPCGRIMRLIFAEPDQTMRKEKRIYQCETCKILETVTVEY